MNVGERKLTMALYFFHHFLAMIVFELLFYIVCRYWTMFSHKDIIELLGVVNQLFLWGAGSVLAIYSGGDVLSNRYRYYDNNNNYPAPFVPYGGGGGGGVYAGGVLPTPPSPTPGYNNPITPVSPSPPPPAIPNPGLRDESQ